MKVSAVHQPPWTTQEMPRNVITFAHAQARQISIHEAVDIPHFVTLPESPVTLKINRIPKSNVSSCVRHNLLCSHRNGDFLRREDNMPFLRVKTSRLCCSRRSECGDCAKRYKQEKKRGDGLGGEEEGQSGWNDILKTNPTRRSLPLSLLVLFVRFFLLSDLRRTPLSESLQQAIARKAHWVFHWGKFCSIDHNKKGSFLCNIPGRTIGTNSAAKIDPAFSLTGILRKPRLSFISFCCLVVSPKCPRMA